MKDQLYNVQCKAPGCHYTGAPDMVTKHFAGNKVPVCPRCRSKNVEVIGLNASDGLVLQKLSLFARVTRRRRTQ